MLDLALAVLHHLIVFAIAAILYAEFISVRSGMEVAAVKRVRRLDAWYAILAPAVIFIGFARAIYAAKGWDYYQGNLYFWAKIATFVLIGTLSIPPTLAFGKWQRANTAPNDEAVASIRRFLLLELLLFAPLLAFAAAMARGYGMT
jgi:putative membrane protein